jgi:hypothetical protein
MPGKAQARTVLVILFVAAGLVLPISSANAATTSGSCETTQGFFANYALDYRIGTVNRVPVRYRWGMNAGGHAIGNKNNIRARTWDATTDEDFVAWISGDDVHSGGGQRAITDVVTIPLSHHMYAVFNFVFDWVDHADPSCADKTQTV